MFEQETASIVKFIQEILPDTFPYYAEIPEDFCYPAVYYPAPTVDSGGDTFDTYSLDFSWYVMFFHQTTQDAYALALKAAEAIRKVRNLVTLIDSDGKITDEDLRLNDPDVKTVDAGAVQLTLSWMSRRPYADTLTDGEKSQDYSINISIKE